MKENPVPLKGIISEKKVLLVEDDAFLGSILEARMKSKGASVIFAKTGESALEELNKGMPDIILLDILLPGINGFEVLQWIRGTDEGRGVPVIVLSNFSQMSDRQKAIELGAEYLVKALVTPDSVVDHLEKLLTAKAR